jgi:hypothetical protein
VTLDDLRDLCKRYVPAGSRHPDSLPGLYETWWWAHEIGHLLTVPLAQIGQPMFGMDTEVLIDRDMCDEHELRCRELAAMSVSWRLMTAAGRRDLAKQEFEDTDFMTASWDDKGRVEEILREHKCLRLPRDRRGLAKKIRQVLRAAKRRQPEAS